MVDFNKTVFNLINYFRNKLFQVTYNNSWGIYPHEWIAQQILASSNTSSAYLSTKTAPMGVRFGLPIYWLTLVRQRGSPSGSVSLPPYITGSSSGSMCFSKTSCQLAINQRNNSIHFTRKDKVFIFCLFEINFVFGWSKMQWCIVSHPQGYRSFVLCSHSESAWWGCRPQEKVWGLQEKNLKVLTKCKPAIIMKGSSKAGYCIKNTKTNTETQVD